MSKILLVEDDATLLTAYKEVFSAEGFNVMTATNGKEAFGIVEGFRPDVILLDLIMPVLDGKKFLKQLGGKQKVVVFSNIAGKIENPFIYHNLLKSYYTPREVVEVIKETLAE